MPHVCVCSKAGSEFSTSYFVVFLTRIEMRGIVWIADHHSLYFLFILRHTLKTSHFLWTYITINILFWVFLWCLTPLSIIFQLYRFIDGGNRSTRRKPSTCKLFAYIRYPNIPYCKKLIFTVGSVVVLIVW
jgi:hypothetical protein